MGSTLTHFSIAILYLLFPGRFDLIALLVGCQIPDLEYIYTYTRKLIEKRNPIKAFYVTPDGFFHTILGAALVCMPIGLMITYSIIFSNSMFFDFWQVFWSLAIGIASHLLLDIPAHRDLLLFFPYVIKENPFLFKMRLGVIETLYPSLENRDPLKVLYETNWLVFSHIFLIAAITIFYYVK